MGREEKCVEYANRVLSTLNEVPKEYWEDVLYILNKYLEYLKEEGRIPKKKGRKRRS